MLGCEDEACCLWVRAKNELVTPMRDPQGSLPRVPRAFGMTSDYDFPRWDANGAEFCARIEKVRSPIKIVLKTKNDPLFIERWITHHMKIVGPENLIIFDNMSDDPGVLSVYRKYRDRIDLVRFADRHYNLHHTYLYRDFYRSLAKSSEYFIFLDTDEYLILIDNDTYHGDDRILTFVMDNRNYDLFPSTWLWNVNWNPAQFTCGTEPADLAENLACGKPLIRSDKIPTGYVNHNFQLSARMFAPPFRTNLFLLHLAHLFPRRRISLNVDKLIVEGVVQPGESPETIARRNDITDEVMAGYVREIRDLLALDGRKDLGNAVLGAGSLELSPNGTISYYSDAERKAVNEFIVDPKPAYDLIADHYRLSAVPGA
jgi:hypothetical protein